MTLGAVIPVYNHAVPVARVARALRAHGLPVLLVDDGSEPGCARALDALAKEEGITLLRLPENQGKGGAVMAGLRQAQASGWTHALQIDADGQHDTADVPVFVAQSRQHPSHFICGCPVYDASVPKGRLYARYLTHIWVWINSLSLSIRDGMCGFRVYPLGPTLELIDSAKLGKRMDFDPEILVRLAWRNQPMHWLPTKVHYPLDGLSHFRLFHDNALISSMHARLFFGMLWRSPAILWRRLRSAA